MNDPRTTYGTRSKLTWTMSAMLLLAVMETPLPVEADPIGVSLSAFGTASIDGILSPGEWDQAAQFGFLANRPATEGGGTIPVTVLEMNDATNLYLAVKIARPSFGGDTTVSFSFDNHHAGAHQNGDDVFLTNLPGGGIIDDFWSNQAPCPIGFCGFSDVAFGGTSDGAAAGSFDGSFTYVEMSHPLSSGDQGHDFSLQPGSVAGFGVSLRLFAFDGSFADSDFPTCGDGCVGSFGDIVIASVPAPGSLSLIASGLCALAMIRRRHRRK